MTKAYLVYGLTNAAGDVFYVGGTCDLKRRLREHKKSLGFRPFASILEHTGDDWREAEHKWIEHFRGMGVPLTNKTNGGEGFQTHGPSARAKLSAAAKGLKRSELHIARIRAGLAGQCPAWSEEGERRVAATRFKLGENNYDQLSDEAKERMRAASSAGAQSLTSEERTRRNKVAWANATPEQRADRGRAIAEGQREWREGYREQNSANRKAYWAKKTPEERKAISMKMIEARERNRTAKRNAE